MLVVLGVVEHWQPTNKYMCEACNHWMPDTQEARRKHESTKRHIRLAEKAADRRERSAFEEEESGRLKRLEKAEEAHQEYLQKQDEIYRATSGIVEPWEYDHETGFYYHYYWRHYYDVKSKYYWGGNPPGWTRKPKIPSYGLFRGISVPNASKGTSSKIIFEKALPSTLNSGQLSRDITTAMRCNDTSKKEEQQESSKNNLSKRSLSLDPDLAMWYGAAAKGITPEKAEFDARNSASSTKFGYLATQSLKKRRR